MSQFLDFLGKIFAPPVDDPSSVAREVGEESGRAYARETYEQGDIADREALEREAASGPHDLNCYVAEAQQAANDRMKDAVETVVEIGMRSPVAGGLAAALMPSEVNTGEAERFAAQQQYRDGFVEGAQAGYVDEFDQALEEKLALPEDAWRPAHEPSNPVDDYLRELKAGVIVDPAPDIIEEGPDFVDLPRTPPFNPWSAEPTPDPLPEGQPSAGWDFGASPGSSDPSTHYGVGDFGSGSGGFDYGGGGGDGGMSSSSD